MRTLADAVAPHPVTPTSPVEEAGFPEEALVNDPRGSLTPAQMVERKLRSLLDDGALPVSQLRMAAAARSRLRG